MALDKNKVDEMLSDFVMRNDTLLVENKEKNPKVYNAVIDALALLSQRFGEGTKFKVKEEVEEKSPKIQETITEEKVKIPQLPFKVRDEFYHKDDKNKIYYIYSIEGDVVGIGINDNKLVNYPLFEAIDIFNKGIWVKTGNQISNIPEKQAPPTKPKDVAPTPTESTPISTTQDGDELTTEDEIKEAIKVLKPLVKFDPDVALEINKLKEKLKTIKKKKA